MCRLFAHRSWSNFVQFVMLLLLSHYQFSLSSFVVYTIQVRQPLCGDGDISDTRVVSRVGAFSNLECENFFSFPNKCRKYTWIHRILIVAETFLFLQPRDRGGYILCLKEFSLR